MAHRGQRHGRLQRHGTELGHAHQLLASREREDDRLHYDGYVAANPSNQLGVSSQHQGGIVLHCSIDGHTGQVTNEIDANLSYSLWSQADGEALTDIP